MSLRSFLSDAGLPRTSKGASPAVNAGCTVRIAEVWQEARVAWPGLADLGVSVDGLPFQTREWIDAWMATLNEHGGAKPFFVTIEDREGQALAHVPFVIGRRFGLKILEGLGGDTVDYYTPLVVRDRRFGRSEADALWSSLADGAVPVDVIHVARIPTASDGAPNALVPSGSRPYPLSGHVARLDGTWTRWFDQRFGRETQKTLKRKRKKLDETGAVEIRFAHDIDEALSWIDCLVAFKNQQMADADVPNGLAAPNMPDFYRNLTTNDPAAKHVRVYALLVDGTPIALQWGIVAGNRFTNLLTSHASGSWARYSPGLMMFRHLFEDCFSKGIDAFDFGIGDEGYKDRFCDQPPVALSTVLRACTLRGRAYILAQSARQGARNSRLLGWGRRAASRLGKRGFP